MALMELADNHNIQTCGTNFERLKLIFNHFLQIGSNGSNFVHAIHRSSPLEDVYYI